MIEEWPLWSLNKKFASLTDPFMRILSDDFKMRHVSEKFVPRQLTTDQMECRMMVAGDLIGKSTQDPKFLTKIVTGDESWVFAYNPEMKMQSAVAHSIAFHTQKKASSNPRKTYVHSIF